MGENLSRILAQISIFSALIPGIIAIWKWRHATPSQQMLRILIGVNIAFEITSVFIGWVLHLQNLYLLHLFTFVEFGVLVMIFRTELKQLLTKKITIVTIIGFAIFVVINAIYFETITIFNSNARAIESLVISFLSLYYFYLTLKELKIDRLECIPMFWISAGLLIYFSSSLFIFIFSNYVITSLSMSFTIWGIHNMFSIVLNIFYGIALWVKLKE